MDGFGIYKKKYHSTRGVYVSFGNQTRSDGEKRENMHIIGLAEPGKIIEEAKFLLFHYPINIGLLLPYN